MLLNNLLICYIFPIGIIPLVCNPLNVAILPIGNNFTMDATDASIAAGFIQCKHIIGCHYDTFGFIKIDKAAATQTFNAKNIALTLLDIGASISV
jgi:L-ascorbate metabolism protein UlaG (beta-lactamase superfamily)